MFGTIFKTNKNAESWYQITDKKRTDYQKYEIQSQLVQIPSEVKKCTESNGDFRSTNNYMCLHQRKASLFLFCGKYKKVISLRCPAFPCILLTFVWEEKKGERRSLLNNVILGSTMLSTGDSRSYTSSCSGKVWEWVREIHLLRLPDLPQGKMSMRRHFAPKV